MKSGPDRRARHGRVADEDRLDGGGRRCRAGDLRTCRSAPACLLRNEIKEDTHCRYGGGHRDSGKSSVADDPASPGPRAGPAPGAAPSRAGLDPLDASSFTLARG